MKIQFGEGQYDNTVAKVRSMTGARHALTIILDGDRGSGFAIHVGGTTLEARIRHTKTMIIAVAQLGRALVAGVERLTNMTTDEVVRDITITTSGFDLQPSPDRCSHCGATLPAPEHDVNRSSSS